jgi:hypothetical protein
VLRRLVVTLAVLGLAVTTGAAGCADESDPAARVGADTVSHDDLLGEVEAWTGSPTLLLALEAGETGSESASGFNTQFVGLVLTNRIAFQLHNAEFEARGLELSDEELEEVRTRLLGDPNATAAALDELGEPYAEQLVADVARQFRVQAELADEYAAWAEESFTSADIEVSPRYGTWDTARAAVRAPEGPRQAPGGSAFEL